MSELEPQEEFCTIEAHIDQTTMESLCRAYVERELHGASVSLFNELLTTGCTFEHALYRAITNQTILEALIKEVKKIEHPIAPFNV